MLHKILYVVDKSDKSL